jgi:prepilin-type N-terminal cleavage/methylation domain-containing protein
MTYLKDERGFTLMELLIATVLTTIVLGGAVAVTQQIQNGYRRQLEDSVGEQEARYALEWIGRYLRSVGNNPFNIPNGTAGAPTCPTSSPATFAAITPDPNADGNNDDITLMSDTNPPDGLLGGSSAIGCNQKNENVKISLNTTLHEVQFQDIGANVTATTRTDAVIDNLQFSYLTGSGAPWTVADGVGNIYYVRTTITIRTRTINVATGTGATRSLVSTVRVRAR